MLPCAQAVLVIGGRDVNGNLDNSGRNLNPAPFSLNQYEGRWGSYTGTPIAPHYFITAGHIGGAIGATFSLGNNDYTTDSVTYQNDVAIWHTTGPAFPVIAPLYTSNNEEGNPLVVVGRSGPRGAAVTLGGELRGWKWTDQTDSPFSWGADTAGQHIVDQGADYLSFPMTGFSDGQGNVTNPDAGGVAFGDSGGGVFVKDPTDNVFKLAGINYSGDGSFNPRGVSDPNYNAADFFDAAMFKANGFYIDGTNIQYPPGGSAIATNSYASSVSANLAFIDGVTGLPEPSAGMALLTAGMSLFRRPSRSSR